MVRGEVESEVVWVNGKVVAKVLLQERVGARLLKPPDLRVKEENLQERRPRRGVASEVTRVNGKVVAEEYLQNSNVLFFSRLGQERILRPGVKERDAKPQL